MAMVYDLIKTVDSKIGDNYQKCMQFMIACIQSIYKTIPIVGIDALEIAKKYWIENSLDESSLEEARVKCWQYLDDKGASTNLEEPEFCALRAVICLLYAESPSEDVSDLIDFYFEMLDKILNDRIYLKKTVDDALLIID